MPSELQPGDVFAGHRIDGVTGRGGMGIVYRAMQLDLHRTIALKLIAPSLAQDPAFRERFIRETRVAANIDHPNVIPVFYAGEDEGRLYLAMRYVDGDDLRTLLRREGRLTPPRAARLINQVGSALDAAHAHGIVHRDVKPANILLGADDHAYLTDFGLTKRLHSASGVTHAGGWVGTMGYVSPEQIRGERVDARSDVYALGCVLHHVLVGAPPHQRDTDEATLWAHLNSPVPEIGPEVPEAFADIIQRALAKDPDDRFQSAGDLGRAAMSAAGLSDGRPDERVVATGAAAPGGAGPPIDQETRVSPTPASTPDLPTVHVPGVAGRETKRSRPAGALLGVAAVSVLAVGGIVAFLIGSVGNDNSPATSTRSAVPHPAGTVIGAPVPAGNNPNDVVATQNSVWATSYRNPSLTRIDPATGIASRGPTIGEGAGTIAAGFGQLWIAKQPTHSLLRLNLATGKRSGDPIPLPSGNPVEVAVDPSGVWIGLRPSTLVKVDPTTDQVQTWTIPDGVADIATGLGAVWITNRVSNSVTRFDIETAEMDRIHVGRAPKGIAVGYGHAWVANSGENTLYSIRAKPPYTVDYKFRTGDTPSFVDVGGGSVWVTNNLDGTLTRIDARSQQPKPAGVVTVNGGPFAISVSGRDAWFTSPGQGTVTHVRAG